MGSLGHYIPTQQPYSVGGFGEYTQLPQGGMGNLMEAPAGMGRYVEAPMGLLEAPAGIGQDPTLMPSAMALPTAGSVSLNHSPSGVFSESVFGFSPGIQQ